MAVPNSGELELRNDIGNEVYGNVTGSDISLHDMSEYAGFSTPDAMSDFYGWSNIELPAVSGIALLGCSTSVVSVKAVADSDGNDPTACFGFIGGVNTNILTNPKICVGGPSLVNCSCYIGSFTGLQYYRTHYFWAFACNSLGQVTDGCIAVRTKAPPFTPLYFEFAQPNSSAAFDLTGPSQDVEMSGWVINPYTAETTKMYSSGNCTGDCMPFKNFGNVNCFPCQCFTNASRTVACNGKNKLCGRVGDVFLYAFGGEDIRFEYSMRANQYARYTSVGDTAAFSPNTFTNQITTCCDCVTTNCTYTFSTIGHCKCFRAFSPFSYINNGNIQVNLCYCWDRCQG